MNLNKSQLIENKGQSIKGIDTDLMFIKDYNKPICKRKPRLGIYEEERFET